MLDELERFLAVVERAFDAHPRTVAATDHPRRLPARHRDDTAGPTDRGVRPDGCWASTPTWTWSQTTAGSFSRRSPDRWRDLY